MARPPSPSSRRRIASSFWCGVSLGFRPRLLLAALARAAFGGAGADKLAFEVGEASKDGQHQAAVRGGGIGPCVAERAKAGVLPADRRERGGRAASPSPRRRRRLRRSAGEAAAGQPPRRLPLPGTLCPRRRREVAGLARQHSG